MTLGFFPGFYSPVESTDAERVWYAGTRSRVATIAGFVPPLYESYARLPYPKEQESFAPCRHPTLAILQDDPPQ